MKHGSQCLIRMFDVLDTLRGLHLDQTKISELKCQLDEILGAESNLVLDQHIFTPEGWEEVSSFSHPTVRVRITANRDGYDHMGLGYPSIAAHIDCNRHRSSILPLLMKRIPEWRIFDERPYLGAACNQD